MVVSEEDERRSSTSSSRRFICVLKMTMGKLKDQTRVAEPKLNAMWRAHKTQILPAAYSSSSVAAKAADMTIR